MPRRALPRSPVDGTCGAKAATAILASMALDPLRATVILNARGGLTLPRAMRRALALDPGGSMIAVLTPEGVLLRPALVFPMGRDRLSEIGTAMVAGEGTERTPRRRKRIQ